MSRCSICNIIVIPVNAIAKFQQHKKCFRKKHLSHQKVMPGAYVSQPLSEVNTDEKRQLLTQYFFRLFATFLIHGCFIGYTDDDAFVRTISHF